MKRTLACAFCLAAGAFITACTSKQTPPAQTNNQSAQTEPKPAKPEATQATQSAPAGELQPGQASGTYTAKGEVVELKYAYAGRAERFGTESMVILLTDKP